MGPGSQTRGLHIFLHRAGREMVFVVLLLCTSTSREGGQGDVQECLELYGVVPGWDQCNPEFSIWAGTLASVYPSPSSV